MYKITQTNDLVEIVFENKQSQIKEFATIGVYYEDTINSGKFMTLEQIQKKNLVVLQYMGFNFSKQQIIRFLNSKNNTLKKSQFLTDLLSNYKSDFYMISYVKNDDDTRNHEIAHYEFWKYDKIPKLINKLTKSNPKLYQEIEKDLIKLGYSKDVVHTEIYAFSKVYEKTLPHKLNCNLQVIKKYI